MSSERGNMGEPVLYTLPIQLTIAPSAPLGAKDGALHRQQPRSESRSTPPTSCLADSTFCPAAMAIPPAPLPDFPSASVYCAPVFLCAAAAAHAAAAAAHDADPAGAPAPPNFKEYVDRPLRAPPADVLSALAAAPSAIAAAALLPALQEGALAEELVDCPLPGEAGSGGSDSVGGGPLRAPPAHLRPAAAALFTDLVGRWPRLCRRTSDAVAASPSTSSSLPLPRPLFVPGGRFREVYYWDSLWILHGLLSSGMPAAARAVVDNWLHLVRVVGHAPNGGRVYYLRRSQPPVLAEMVWAIVWEAAGLGGLDGGVDMSDGGGATPDIAAMAAALSAADIAWLAAALPALDTEYAWFMHHRAVRLVVSPGESPRLLAADETPATATAGTPGAAVVTLNAYGAQGDAVAAATATAGPRPESYPTDSALEVELIGQLRASTSIATGCEGVAAGPSTAAEAVRGRQLHRHVVAAAESGWDFSSRWLSSAQPGWGPGRIAADTAAAGAVAADEIDKETYVGLTGRPSIRTAHIIPVCLNSLLLRTERRLADLHSVLAAVDAGRHMRGVGAASNSAAAAAAATPFFSSSGVSATAPDHAATASVYRTAEAAREAAISAVLYSPTRGTWGDWDAPRRAPTGVVAASDWLPLWAGRSGGVATAAAAAAAVASLKQSGLVAVGGVRCTVDGDAAGLQWDTPNAWPPVQQLLVEGLRAVHAMWGGGLEVSTGGNGGDDYRGDGVSGGDYRGDHSAGGPVGGAAKLAATIANGTLATVAAGWGRPGGVMHEKYDALAGGGERGRGGEYAPQEGFGWTNGVTLWLLERYAGIAPSGEQCDNEQEGGKMEEVGAGETST